MAFNVTNIIKWLENPNEKQSIKQHVRGILTMTTCERKNSSLVYKNSVRDMEYCINVLWRKRQIKEKKFYLCSSWAKRKMCSYLHEGYKNP